MREIDNLYTMSEQGNWNNFCRRWEINYSNILSRLILLAGRYCDNHSSDLFIFWENHIIENITERDWESETAYLAFYGGGVDWATTDSEYDHLKETYDENPYMYRKIVELNIVADGNKILMSMKDVFYLTKRKEGIA